MVLNLNWGEGGIGGGLGEMRLVLVLESRPSQQADRCRRRRKSPFEALKAHRSPSGSRPVCTQRRQQVPTPDQDELVYPAHQIFFGGSRHDKLPELPHQKALAKSLGIKDQSCPVLRLSHKTKTVW